MTDRRLHPDLFTREEAAVYLHLFDAEGKPSIGTLDTLREKKWLTGYRVGPGYIYWREDLDDCALKMVGKEPPARTNRKPLALAK